MPSDILKKEISIQLPDAIALFLVTAVALCALNVYLLHAGEYTGKTELLAEIEACLDKPLTNGMAECDDPNFIVRTTPSGAILVISAPEKGLGSGLRELNNEALFGPLAKDPNFIQRHLEPQDIFGVGPIK